MNQRKRLKISEFELELELELTFLEAFSTSFLTNMAWSFFESVVREDSLESKVRNDGEEDVKKETLASALWKPLEGSL